MTQFKHGLLHARAVFGIVFFLFLVQPLVYAAKEGKILGKTYEVIEPDAYEEILEAAKKVNLEKYKKALQERIKQLAVIGDEFKLPYAKETKTRYYEPRYELSFDIKDEKGGIIYPKGFTFNPLQYMSLYGSFVFFDARNALHLNWLKKGGYTKRIDVMLIAVRGNIIEAEKVLKAPVYKATRSIIERFDVKKIPCIIRQNGKYLEITEVGEKDVEKIAYR